MCLAESKGKIWLTSGGLQSHFTESETRCHCGCGSKKINVKLISLLEILKNSINKPIIVLSGTRCEKHNKEVGGAVGSAHLEECPVHTFGTGSEGVDIECPNLDIEQFFKKAGELPFGGIGLYKGNSMHVDIRVRQHTYWYKNQTEYIYFTDPEKCMKAFLKAFPKEV